MGLCYRGGKCAGLQYKKRASGPKPLLRPQKGEVRPDSASQQTLNRTSPDLLPLFSPETGASCHLHFPEVWPEQPPEGRGARGR